MQRMFRSLLTSLIVIGFFSLLPVAAQDSTAEGTVRITLRACNDGIDPQRTPDQCDIPIDAPERAAIQGTEGSNRFHQPVNTDTPRENDGTYVIEGVPANDELSISSFMPMEHNYFMYDGVDAVTDFGWTGTFTLAPDETRDISVYYWNGSEGLIEPGTNEVHVLLRGCPDGVDPNVDSSECTIPLDAPDKTQWGSNHGTGRAVYLKDENRLHNGAYVIEDLAPYSEVTIGSLDGTEHNAWLADGVDGFVEGSDPQVPLIDMKRGETREMTVYYYNDDGSSTQPGDTATLKLTFRGCPDDVDPANTPDACTTPLDAPPGAQAGDVQVVEMPREYDGTYVIEDIAAERVSLTAFNGSVYQRWLFDGVDDVGDHGFGYVDLQPGETRHVTIYYYNSGS